MSIYYNSNFDIFRFKKSTRLQRQTSDGRHDSPNKMIVEPLLATWQYLKHPPISLQEIGGLGLYLKGASNQEVTYGIMRATAHTSILIIKIMFLSLFIYVYPQEMVPCDAILEL